MRRGFTLIELLAVIVILAIIALIAVPIVINIISDTKESSEEESVKLYKDTVNKMLVRKQMTDPTFNPSKCEIKTDGNLECTVGNNKVDVEVEVKGKKPNSGIITIKDNKLIFRNIEYNNKKYDLANLVEDVGSKGLSVGDKYTYDAMDNMNEPYEFYVLSIEGDKVSLIMDRNICEDGQVPTSTNKCTLAWYSGTNDTSYGPVTAMTALYNATKNWSNVPDMDLSGSNAYTDEVDLTNQTSNYGKIETTLNGIKITMKDGTEVPGNGNSTPTILYDNGKKLKARLPMLSEVKSSQSKCNLVEGSCEPWLIENLKYWNGSDNKYYINEDDTLQISGYWLLATSSNFNAYIVGYTGLITQTIPSYVGGIGIRPVITVSKSDLS